MCKISLLDHQNLFAAGGFAPWTPTNVSRCTHSRSQGGPQTPCLVLGDHIKTTLATPLHCSSVVSRSSSFNMETMNYELQNSLRHLGPLSRGRICIVSHQVLLWVSFSHLSLWQARGPEYLLLPGSPWVYIREQCCK